MIPGDMNENILCDKGINKSFLDIGLVNVIDEKLTLPEKVRSYDRGSCIIDCVRATPIVCDHIEHIALAPFYTEVISDHRPIILDLNLKGLLDAKTIDIRPPMGRRLKFKSPKRVKKKVEHVNKEWE